MENQHNNFLYLLDESSFCPTGYLCHLFVSFYINAQKLSSLEEALCEVDSSDPTTVSAIIDKYSEQPVLKGDSVCRRLALTQTDKHIQ